MATDTLVGRTFDVTDAEMLQVQAMSRDLTTRRPALSRLAGHEHLRCDLRVRETLGKQFDHSPFGRGHAGSAT